MRKTVKVILCLAITAAMMLSLSSCADGVFSAAIVLDYRGNTEDSFNLPALAGFETAKSNFNIKGTVYKGKDDEQFNEAFTKASKNCDLVIALGYQGKEKIIEAARLNPQTHYVSIDVSFDGREVTDNLVGISYRSEESSFLAGYIAGMTTKSCRVGFIGGVSGVVDSFEYGYRAGVDFASDQRGVPIDVTVEYLGDFYDRSLAEKTAIKLYSERCDVIYQAAGSAGIGVITAAKKTEHYCIGVDVDQSEYAPECVLTSALKDTKYTVISTIDDYKSGSVYASGTKSLGLKEGGVGLPDNNPLIPKDIMDRVTELKDLIINDQIEPPATAEDFEKYMNKE